MPDPELTLYAESTWVSPWVFHAMVALEEKGLPYKLEVVPIPIPPAQRGELENLAVIGKVPILAHGDFAFGESLAISEYLAERFPFPDHPRLFPADLAERARARQVMSMARTSMFALRGDRPTSGVFGPPTILPMSDKARAEATELVRLASRVVRPGAKTMFDAWCIADADLTLLLMRLIAHQDPVPPHLVDYARAQWERPSVQRFLSHVPPA